MWSRNHWYEASGLACHLNTVSLNRRSSRHMNFRVHTWNTRQSIRKIASSLVLSWLIPYCPKWEKVEVQKFRTTRFPQSVVRDERLSASAMGRADHLSVIGECDLRFKWSTRPSFTWVWLLSVTSGLTKKGTERKKNPFLMFFKQFWMFPTIIPGPSVSRGFCEFY